MGPIIRKCTRCGAYGEWWGGVCSECAAVQSELNRLLALDYPTREDMRTIIDLQGKAIAELEKSAKTSHNLPRPSGEMPALLDELDEILATGCGILGKIGRLKEIARQLRAGNKKGAPLCPKCNSSYTVQIASPFGCDNCGHTW